MELDPADRVPAIARECGGNKALVAYVQRLIEADALDTEAFGNALPGQQALSSTWMPDAGPLQQEVTAGSVGPYRILRVLGAGGMGIVYLAQQTVPVDRLVALKVVRANLGNTTAGARFTAERQAMARMSHINVAQIFEAATTEEGWPYFVMEYIDGQGLLEYCDENRLALRQRLRLLIDVAMGVQHAHQRGIMHRDLKPSNVLVSEHDGRPIAKVIDFGIAKALDGSLTAEAGLTGQAVIGTPAYMSPESLHYDEGAPDVDTRTDVYALGVMLYELITGVRPFEDDGANVVKLLMRIAHADAPRPSARFVSQTQADMTDVAARRHTDPVALRKTLEGDLDWIAAKATARDREERYGTASELAADLERYLADEAVTARPPSLQYRMGKFTKRHRPAVAAFAAVFVALVLGVVGTTTGMISANRAAERARVEAAAATEVADFLTGMFEVSDPSEARGNRLTAREVLDRGAENIEADLAGEPAVQAQMMLVMGRVYAQLGLYDDAIPLLMRSVALRREQLGDRHPDVASSLNELAISQARRGDYDAADANYLEALDIRRAGHGADEDLPETLSDYAVLQSSRGNLEEAAALNVEALEIRRGLYGVEHEHIARSLDNSALVFSKQGDFSTAIDLHRQALAMRRKLKGADHPAIAHSLNNLGLSLFEYGEVEEAEMLYQESLAVTRRVLGERHHFMATVLNNLALVREHHRDFERAEALNREALSILAETVSEENGAYARSLCNLAGVLSALGRSDEARPLYEQAQGIFAKTHGEDSQQYAHALGRLGLLHKQQGEYEAALPLYRQALDIKRRKLGREHPVTAISANNLAVLLFIMGEAGEAEALYREALENTKAALSLGHPRIYQLWRNFVQQLWLTEKRQAALDELDALQAEVLEVHGGRHLEMVEALVLRAQLLVNKGDYDGAEAPLREALKLLEDLPEATEGLVEAAREGLAQIEHSKREEAP